MGGRENDVKDGNSWRIMNEIFLNERVDVNDEHWDYIQNETVRP